MIDWKRAGGCLLIIAASLLIDGLTLWAAVSLARMIIGG